MSDGVFQGVCIMGPTASGKTALAVELARRLPVQLISVDSVMIYRGMDIGSAKPDPATLAAAPHRLIDILDPAESYSAARFVDDAEHEIAYARAAGRLPLLVGGTMLYFRALQQGLSPLPAADPALRAALTADCQRLGSPALHARLAEVDPKAAERIHPNDPQRILRALEIFQLSGRPATELFRHNVYQDRARWLNIALLPADRSLLHRHIEQRFYQMLEQGLVAEVETLHARPDLSLDNPAVRAVGYRQVWQYLDGLTDYAAMVQGGIVATRQFAKRQMTWLRADEFTQSTVAFNSQQGALLDNVLAVLQEYNVVINGNL